MKRRLAVLAAAVVLSGCADGAGPGTGRGFAVRLPDSEGPCASASPPMSGTRDCRSAELVVRRSDPVARPSGPSHRPAPTSPPRPARWTGTAAEKRFAWAERTGFPEDAATVTLLRGRSPRVALAMVATDPTTPVEPAAHVVGRAGAEDGEPVVAGRLPGGWTIVVEYNGFNATDDAVAARLSARGTAVVIFRNVNADSSFQYAVGGRLVRSFDPLLFGPPWVGHPMPQERGIHFGDAHDLNPMAQSFLLAYRLTGVAVRARDVWRTAGYIGVANRV